MIITEVAIVTIFPFSSLFIRLSTPGVAVPLAITPAASIRVGPGRAGPAGPGRPAGPALIRPDRLCGDGEDAGDLGGRGDIGGQGRWRKYRRCRRYCRRYRRWRRRGGAASDPPRPAADLRPPRHAGLLRRECIPVTTTRSLCLGLRVS